MSMRLYSYLILSIASLLALVGCTTTSVGARDSGSTPEYAEDFGGSITIDEAQSMLTLSVKTLVNDVDWGMSDSSRCIAIYSKWNDPVDGKEIPPALLTPVVENMQSLPMPVYAVDSEEDAIEGCERELTQFISIERPNLFEIDEGKIFMRVKERGVGNYWGGSDWEYVFQRQNQEWRLVKERGLGAA